MKKRIVAISASVSAIILIVGAVLLYCGLSEGSPKTFDAYFAYQGKSVSENNRVRLLLDKATGVHINMRYLTSGTVEDEINLMISQGKYPDFIDGSSCTAQLIGAGALVPLEGYIKSYPNLSSYLSEEEWEKMKSADGHIYIIPQFGIVQGHETDTTHREEAFFIQKAVLEWAGYPKISTAEEYFTLIESYASQFPEINGGKTVGFQILCDDWRGFCLSNPPQFLAGYPNDGCAIVDPVTLNAKLYDFTEEARSYYNILCRCFDKGLIRPETFLETYDQYIAMLKTGRVLGMVDQYWQFESAQNALYEAGMPERTYIPLGLTINDGVTEHYRSLEALDTSNGIGITIGCTDVEGALAFIDKLLEPDNMTLRYWGEEEKDYYVDKEGCFYRTDEQRANAANSTYSLENFCAYKYFPHYDGMLSDGINTVKPDEQTNEYYQSLCAYDRDFLSAYGYDSWVEFLNPPEEVSPWFPLYTFTNNLTDGSKIGQINNELSRLRSEWLPQVIMSGEEGFDEIWEEYRKAVYKNDIALYENTLTEEVKRRCEKS